jgi:TonB-dependent Receptor Plug Domain
VFRGVHPIFSGVCFATLAAAIFATSAEAQTPTDIPRIEINAPRTQNAAPTLQPIPALPANAASEQIISGGRMNEIPASRPGEFLETAPGLIVTQHSGEGKANQYFLRGFNLDHGTDLAITIDGMPVNMRTHGHGQGYADVNFLIPELIGAMRVRKGPYYADEGDFSSAGALHIDLLDQLKKNLIEGTVGGFGYRLVLAANSVQVGAGTLLGALEVNTYDGPWDVPDNVRKFNGVIRYSQGTQSDGFSLTAMGYSNKWTSTDQVAQRAIDSGAIGRLGSLDSTDGGKTERFSLSGRWSRSDDKSATRVDAYVIKASLTLFNNFTYFLS